MRFNLILLLAVSAVMAYPNGPPNTDVVCKQMRPNHAGQPQSGSSSYTISVSRYSVPPEGSVVVTVNNTAGTAFKGMLLMARMFGVSDNQSTPVGYFPPITAFRDCCAASNGSKAICHAQPLTASSQSVLWIAHNLLPGQIVQFFATVVQNYLTYWVKLSSPIVYVIPETTTTSLAPPTEAMNSLQPSDQAQCLQELSALRAQIAVLQQKLNKFEAFRQSITQFVGVVANVSAAAFQDLTAIGN